MSMNSLPSRVVSVERLDAPVSLVDALFAKTRKRVLGILFGQPDRSFYTKELIGLARSGSGAVQRELRRLTSSGLTRMVSVGAQKHYQANPDSPIYHELVGIMRKTVAVADPIRQSLDPVADRIRLAVIFGSVARGTDTAGSDIDLLVVADDLMLEELYAALGPVEELLSRKINPMLYTAQEFNARRSSGHPFLSRVFAEKRMVLIGEKNGIPAT